MTATATLDKPKASPTAGRLWANVARDDLLSALTFAGSAVDRRPIVPVLGGVLLTVAHSTLTASCTNYDLYTEATCAAPRGKGSALAPAGLLRQMVAALPKGSTVELRVHGEQRLSVAAGGITFQVPLMPTEDYPAGGVPESRRTLTMTGAELASLGQVLPAASRDDTVPILECVQLAVVDGTLRAAATDRYRLAVLDTGKPASLLHPINVPAQLVRLAVKLFRRAPGVGLSVVPGEGREPARWVVYSAGRWLVGNLTDGSFPAYASLVPKPDDYRWTLTADVDTMLAAVKAATLAIGGHWSVRLCLRSTGSTFESGDQSWDGSTTAVVPIAGAYLRGDDATASFNPAFVADGYRVFAKDDRVTMRLTLPNKPAVFHGASRPGLTYLLMPVRP